MRTLIAKLLARFKDFEYRHTYVESFEDSLIATQIKVLREQRHLSQTELATLAGMKQSQISSMEDVNHGSWKISTLRRLARAFDLVLVVRFETFGSAVKDIDKFSRESLQRPSFEKECHVGKPTPWSASVESLARLSSLRSTAFIYVTEAEDRIRMSNELSGVDL